MTSASPASSVPATSTSAAPPKTSTATVRFPWFSLGSVIVYWTVVMFVRAMEVPFFFRFLFGMAVLLPLFLIFSGWWWSRRKISLADRAVGYALVIGGAFAAAPLSHASIGLITALITWLPIMISVWIVGAYAVQRLAIPQPRLVSLLAAAVVWSSVLLVRNEGMDGDLRPDLHWRWSKTAEQHFLADQPRHEAAGNAAEEKSASPITAGAGDWTGFRGSSRDGKVYGTSIDTDWKKNPPKLVWKQRIGPGWSSVCVIGNRLFTQEQRGEQEAVVCYNAGSGEQIWVHEDTARFYEAVSSAGPRATPTFADERIYTLGATGIVNCLSASSGKVLWRHSLPGEYDNQIQMWGHSASPLVANGLAIVYGGGKVPNLFAFDAETGKKVWQAQAGETGYGSPQLATLSGQTQILLLSDSGVLSVEPTTGKQLWQAGAAAAGAPRSLQPQIADDTHFVLGTYEMSGVALVSASKTGKDWAVTHDWSSATAMKPEFSDMVVHKKHIYGFDGAILCCLEVATGERLWKGGRYGRGQVLLLADQDLLLVLSEKGEAILVSATPDEHQELSRLPAITGKCWNHPVIAHGRLYVRNAEEIACYQLPVRGE